MECPHFEVLYEGTRGPGKTDALLMSFAQFVGKGFGQAWRGPIFREEYKELADVVAKSKKWFRQIFPGARFLESKADYKWVFPDGEELMFRAGKKEDDYWDYHGHEYPFLGFEELTKWASPAFYESMLSTCRSSVPGMPRMIRATTNPYGAGHNWVKARFIDPAPAGIPFDDGQGRKRVRIHGHIRENRILLKNDPEYIATLQNIKDLNKRKAWLDGDWDIVAGGMFDDVWRESKNAIQPFEIPSSWRIDRAFDWGSSKPFSVGWYAESDGSPAKLKDGTERHFPRGSVFRIAEWYGWNGQPNEGCRMLAVNVAKGIVKRERQFEWGGRVKPGPADSAIFTNENGSCIADDMAGVGVRWTAANKSPGSRVNGWEKLRELIDTATQDRPEEPGLWVFDTCRQFIRTVPVLSRDSTNPDDIDTDTEDHIADECRYRVASGRNQVTVEPLRL